MGVWEFMKGLKLDSGDALIAGSVIGYLLQLRNPLFLDPYTINSTSSDLQWLHAMGIVSMFPFMSLFTLGLFLKNNWILKLIGALLLYYIVYQLTWEIVTIKPYVVALKGFLE